MFLTVQMLEKTLLTSEDLITRSAVQGRTGVFHLPRHSRQVLLTLEVLLLALGSSEPLVTHLAVQLLALWFLFFWDKNNISILDFVQMLLTLQVLQLTLHSSESLPTGEAF